MSGKINFSLPSPIQLINDPLFDQKKVQVYFKRDDLIHPDISGNKWRKLKYNLNHVEGKSVLTFGGAFSNHIAATAAACNEYSIKSIGIIRGERPKKLNNTLILAEINGMELHFISREEYRLKNEPEFLDKLKTKFDQPLIIPEGGSNTQGVKGCAEVVDEIDFDFDYLISAVGTGTTISGITSALKKNQKSIGISVLKGAEYLEEEIYSQLKNYLGEKKADLQFRNMELNHDYHFGGYAKIKPELIGFMNEFYINHQIKTDPIYSGKSLFALFDMIKNDQFTIGSTIVYYHCGGLQGIEGMENRYGIKLF